MKYSIHQHGLWEDVTDNFTQVLSLLLWNTIDWNKWTTIKTFDDIGSFIDRNAPPRAP